MYKIIGIDGREYGPVSAEQIRHWISAGRADANTKARGEGIALAMLVKLLDWARAERLPLARLETGNVSVGALKLYRRAGFKEIPAFPPYEPDPLSIFMERALR